LNIIIKNFVFGRIVVSKINQSTCDLDEKMMLDRKQIESNLYPDSPATPTTPGESASTYALLDDSMKLHLDEQGRPYLPEYSFWRAFYMFFGICCCITCPCVFGPIIIQKGYNYQTVRITFDDENEVMEVSRHSVYSKNWNQNEELVPYSSIANIDFRIDENTKINDKFAGVLTLDKTNGTQIIISSTEPLDEIQSKRSLARAHLKKWHDIRTSKIEQEIKKMKVTEFMRRNGVLKETQSPTKHRILEYLLDRENEGDQRVRVKHLLRNNSDPEYNGLPIQTDSEAINFMYDNFATKK
jgi:frataxin-like iron-binding protein CyaY